MRNLKKISDSTQNAQRPAPIPPSSPISTNQILSSLPFPPQITPYPTSVSITSTTSVYEPTVPSAARIFPYISTSERQSLTSASKSEDGAEPIVVGQDNKNCEKSLESGVVSVESTPRIKSATKRSIISRSPTQKSIQYTQHTYPETRLKGAESNTISPRLSFFTSRSTSHPRTPAVISTSSSCTRTPFITDNKYPLHSAALSSSQVTCSSITPSEPEYRTQASKKPRYRAYTW